MNTRELLGQLSGGRGRLPASTDTELLTALLADEPATDTVDALVRVLPRVHGAFTLVVLDERRVIGVRDPFGFRPLVLGRLPIEEGSRGDAGSSLWPDDEPGWCLSSRDRRPRHRRRGVRPRRRAGRDRHPRAGPRAALRPLRAGEPRAVRLRADLLRPARLVHGGPQPVRGPAADGRAARPRAPRGLRPRHARPRHRRRGRGRLRRGVRDPVPRGPRPQPLHAAGRSSSRPRRCASGA